MSRSALWRQEDNAKEREAHAQELFEEACAEGRRKHGTLAIWGEDCSFHFHPVLLRNTIQSSYFQKCCQLHDWNAIIDEIYYEVKHLQVFQVGQQPSSAFCLLLRLLTFRMTKRQVEQTISHPDSPYIRGIGFLYLRYAGPPDQVYEIIEPYLQDDEEFTLEPAERRDAETITMGEFVRDLFQSRDYYNSTPLPRIPNERDLHVKLLAVDKIARRAVSNSRKVDQFRVGSNVMALYRDDENPVTWYQAVIDRIITNDETTNRPYKYPRYVATFPEYGNTETVTLGELDVVGGDASSGREERGLYDQVRRREQSRVTDGGRDGPRRTQSTKQSLPSRDHRRHGAPEDDRDFRRHNNSRGYQHQPKLPPSQSSSRPEALPTHTEHKRTPDELATIAEKKRKLMAKYG